MATPSSDRYGNRTAQSVTIGTAPSNSVVVNAATNQITTSGYSYDASGNMLNDAINTMTYDAENRALTSSGTYGSATYTYDGNGLRVEKSGSNGSTIYIFSGSKVIAEYAPSAQASSPTTEYIYAGANLVASVASGTPTYYHPDQLSNRALTSSTGSVVGQQGTYPFGESWYASGTATKWKFTSYERDPESANDYAMARYDVNRLGRFNSPDPIPGSIADPQSLNAYSYVRNDPANFVDPFGLDPVCITTAVGSRTYNALVNGVVTVIQESYYHTDCYDDGAVTGGAGSNGGGDSTGATQTQSPQQQTQNCLNNYNNSSIGKGIKFFSLYNLATNFKNAWMDWTLFPAIKIGTATVLKSTSQAVGNTEFLSLTGGTSTVVTAPTAAGVDAIETAAAPVAPFAIGGATLLDAAVHAQCTLDPSLPPEGIPIGPK
jgi:RHS repeat-associated protein